MIVHGFVTRPRKNVDTSPQYDTRVVRRPACPKRIGRALSGRVHSGSHHLAAGERSAGSFPLAAAHPQARARFALVALPLTTGSFGGSLRLTIFRQGDCVAAMRGVRPSCWVRFSWWGQVRSA
jgi:hypothetical protein